MLWIGFLLGVLRFRLIIGAETSIGVTAGVKIGISTMAAIPVAFPYAKYKLTASLCVRIIFYLNATLFPSITISS